MTLLFMVKDPVGIRYGNWSDAHIPVASAANWAMSFSDSLQKYIILTEQ